MSDPNCLQRLSANDTGKQRVKEDMVFGKVNSSIIPFDLILKFTCSYNVSSFLGVNTSIVRPNKKISVFRVTGQKILGRVGTCNCIKLMENSIV